MSDIDTVLVVHSSKADDLFITYIGEFPLDDRPYLASHGRKLYWAFTEEIHHWFVKTNIAYELGGYPDTHFGYYYKIIFDSKDKAALFKLTFL